MNRYLFNVSYIGTQFRGVQKIMNRNEPYKPDFTTIQGILEIALKKLKPVNDIHVVPSSRTDTGVHAISSTFHVDLLRNNGDIFETNSVTSKLNKYLNANQMFIRINNTKIVPKTFHCRYSAKSRTYLYRIGIINDNEITQLNNILLCKIPIEEYGRCHFINSQNFDMEKVKETSKLLTGLNDFRSFMGRGSHYSNKMTRRTLEIQITKEEPFNVWFEGNLKLNRIIKDYINHWNFIFKSEGFLYNQEEKEELA